MQTAPHYSNVVEEVTAFFQAQLSHARTLGLEDFLILDPGIGFGKSLEDNLALLRGLSSFHVLGRPLFIGTSRKSFIGALTGAPLEDRLPGSLASALFSFAQGVQFLRVHDVASTKQALTLYSSLLSL
jgi:dihydropteroate synthase